MTGDTMEPVRHLWFDPAEFASRVARLRERMRASGSSIDEEWNDG